MVEFRHLLCPTDLSEPSGRSLTYAAALARWYKAQLTVLYVVPPFDPMPVRSASLDGAVQSFHTPSREEVLAELRRVVDAAGAGSLDAVLAAEVGDPYRTIIDQAAAIHADLVVMGTHGRSGSERFMIGSVAEKVLRKAPCPVLVVPPHVTAAVPTEVRFENILCPMDFSPSAMQAFGFALDLAQPSDGAVTVLHVIEWLAEDEPRESGQFSVPEYRQHLIADAHQRVQALVAEHARTRRALHAVVVLGRAHREIIRIAGDSPADLIVMGAQGRGGLGLALFGSTTHQVGSRSAVSRVDGPGVRRRACAVTVPRTTRRSRPGRDQEMRRSERL